MNKRHPIEALIAEGEHQQLDFKFEVSDSRKIARTLAAFANTHGGRLLIGVKDNGVISGIRSDEEYYMIEAAARLYTRPEVPFEAQRWVVRGRTVLEVRIAPSRSRPHTAPDKEAGRYRAYIRAADENLPANGVLVAAWRKQREGCGARVEIGPAVGQLLAYLDAHPHIDLGRFCRIARISRHEARRILSDLLAMEVLEYLVVEKRICYRLAEHKGER